MLFTVYKGKQYNLHMQTISVKYITLQYYPKVYINNTVVKHRESANKYLYLIFNKILYIIDILIYKTFNLLDM